MTYNDASMIRVKRVLGLGKGVHGADESPNMHYRAWRAFATSHVRDVRDA